MQMQEGIGRGGYRLLALVFAGLGGLGVIATLVAFEEANLTDFFRWLGFALTTAGILALLAVVLVILSPSAARSSRSAPEPDSLDPMPTEESGLPDAMGAQTNPGVEFVDAEPAPLPPAAAPPAPRGPPPRPQPPPPPFVHPPSRPRDSKGWPERKGPSGRTRRDVAEATFAAPDAPVPASSAREAEPPLIMARTAASAEAAGLPDHVSVGKCGNCSALLVAPKKRPLRLQCPRCERVHTLA